MENAKKGNMGKIISTLANLLIAVCILGVFGFMLLNPQVWKGYLPSQEVKEAEPLYVADIYSKLDVLSRQVNEVENLAKARDDYALEELQAKYDEMAKLNANVIDSKADASMVLGMVERMDRVEESVAKAAKISDKGALVLTAVMLVKERAERGDKFQFEAEILHEIADGDAKIEAPVAVIEKLAVEGVPTNFEIINHFMGIYLKANAPIADGLSWWQRLKVKTSELVQVRRVGEETSVDLKKVKMDEVKQYVETYRYAKALEASEGLDLDQGWLKMVRDRLEFDRAVSKIAAYSLAVMKVNALRGEQ